MTIRILDPILINQIAAGEVIERPASALKELVENAIDAGASQIDVVVRNGGRTFISVVDNGGGMNEQDLALCVERYATSKMGHHNLFDIKSLGFRGEALPSIASVSRLSIASRHLDAEHGWQITVEGGQKNLPEPIALAQGTRVEVRDLFFATPARLKFLKTAATEFNYAKELLNRLSLAYPAIGFSLTDDEKRSFSYRSSGEAGQRFKEILGEAFVANTLTIEARHHNMELAGAVSLPTYNRGNAQEQYFFVNGRVVKDKLLSVAVRLAYQDFLAHDRHPMVVLFLTLQGEEVDINVHPAKAEVRFRDSQEVRTFVTKAIRDTLRTQENRTSTTLADKAVNYFKPVPAYKNSFLPLEPATYPKPNFTPAESIPVPEPCYELAEEPPAFAHTFAPSPPTLEWDFPLGLAKAQIMQTYILAETPDTLVIVDQHAAHERLLYEKLKAQQEQKALKRQVLLIPEVVHVTEKEWLTIQPYLETINSLGLVVEAFGQQTLLVREVPVLLQAIKLQELLQEIIEEIEETETPHALATRLLEKLASHSCKHSVKAGQKLSLEEMNALLRQMEKTPGSGQCNHGRPTFVTLAAKDIAKLFGRR